MWQVSFFDHAAGFLPHISAPYDLGLLQRSCVFWAGFSDPYCMLTIMEDEEESRTRKSRAKPSKSVVKDAVSGDKIYQTEIKKQTLNPIWNQTFILWVNVFIYEPGTLGYGKLLTTFSFCFREFEDVIGASFHLEMWWENIQGSSFKTVFLLLHLISSTSVPGIRMRRFPSLRN